jgi:endonuclease/exonuclease/phosphatase family metal-dependent hydrolase
VSFRVMTFNILHDAVRNLCPPWSARRPAVVATIRAEDPDVACLQEVSVRQLEALKDDLPEYEFIRGVPTGLTRVPRFAAGLLGLARPILGDFLDRGELCPVLVRRERLAVADHGSMRMSFSQAGLGPAWADSPTPHVVTWVRLEAVGKKNGHVPTVYNTHLGVLPWNWARTAQELLHLLGHTWQGEGQILVGDFNALPNGPLLRILRSGGGDSAAAFCDSWRIAESREGGRRTFHWGFGWSGPQLDYVMVRPRMKVTKVHTVRDRVGLIFPSDHFPVTADLELNGAR